MEVSNEKLRGDSIPPVQLRLLRVQAGVDLYMRFLSPRIAGLFVHWMQGRGHYCEGDQRCSPAVHRLPRIWRGYLSAEFWIKEDQVWWPCVLEVTESLELDFRGIYTRGQLWNITRPRTERGKKEGVKGTLLEQLDAQQLPQAADILPVLKHTYHRDDFDLRALNPLPPRPGAIPSRGPGPKCLDKAPTLDQGEPVRRRSLREECDALRTSQNGSARN